MEVEHDVDKEDDVNNGVHHQQTRKFAILVITRRGGEGGGEIIEKFGAPPLAKHFPLLPGIFTVNFVNFMSKPRAAWGGR